MANIPLEWKPAVPAFARKLLEPPRKATYQDILDAPDNMVAEIIHGELYLSARPADPHVWAYAKLHGEIEMKFARDPDGDGDVPAEWAILPEPELRLGQDVLVPDSAGWRVEKLHRNQAIRFNDVVPDWVCEVLSPSTREFDLGRKSDICAREGVKFLWIIDTAARTLQASVLTNGNRLPISTLLATDMITVPPFGKLNIPLCRQLPGGPLCPRSE